MTAETPETFDREAAVLEEARARAARIHHLESRLAELQAMREVPVVVIERAWVEWELRKLGAADIAAAVGSARADRAAEAVAPAPQAG